MSNYTIKKTDRRERLYEHLREHTGNGHTSQAIDEAVTWYLRMRGDSMVNPGSHPLKELMQLAEEQGSLTPQEIAEVLDTEEVPVRYSSEWSIGSEEDD